MDPLSVLSGVAGLVALASTLISKTTSYIVACRHASEDSLKLLHELQLLIGVLYSVSGFEEKLRAANLQPLIQEEQVLACRETLQGIINKLNKSDPKADGLSIRQRGLRMLKWPFEAKEHGEFMIKLGGHKSTFQMALSADTLGAVLASLQASSTTLGRVDETKNTVDKLWEIETTKEQRSILESLGYGKAAQSFSTNLELRQPGTGSSFLTSTQFNTWLAERSSKLWVYGIPGAGKTTLSTLAIQETQMLATESHRVVFFYCSHRDKEAQLTSLLSCLVGQLAHQSETCMQVLMRDHRLGAKSSVRAGPHEKEDLLRVLDSMTNAFDQVSVIVDGIDEWAESASIAEALAALASNVPQIRMLLFSRDEPQIRGKLKGFHSLSVSAASEDLRLYVSAEIEKRTGLDRWREGDPSVTREISSKLISRAEGM
jgi:hypothetical protein